MKRHGGFIPGIRPGETTAQFLDYAMTRLTFAGAIFLTALAVLPMLVQNFLGVPSITAQFFGGTGLLIIVGVMLDTMRQAETYLLQRHYDGFLKKGRDQGAEHGWEWGYGTDDLGTPDSLVVGSDCDHRFGRDCHFPPLRPLGPCRSFRSKMPLGIAGMRASCRLARKVLEELVHRLEPGRTTGEVDKVGRGANRQRGSEECFSRIP